MGFSLPLLLGLLAACAVMMVLERRGLPTTLSLTFKGDIKRESRWLAQYGQFVCTFVAALLVWQLDASNRWRVVPILVELSPVSSGSMQITRAVSCFRPDLKSAGYLSALSLEGKISMEFSRVLFR